LIGVLLFRKLAILAQTRDLRRFRFTKNASKKFFNVRSRDMGNSPLTFDISPSASNL